MASRSPAPDAGDYIPPFADLPELAQRARNCKACDLWLRGTQTVFGEGPPSARLFLVGEQPGDREDIEGRPFVGPAGAMLDRCLETAGIARQDVYVTNAVKHFKWEARGKRRIHSKPGAREIRACLPWLESELALVQPGVVVCLGATAVRAVLGPGITITEARGRWNESPLAARVTATVHPSALLRAPTDEERHAATARFVHDLRFAATGLR
jgi:DNA polymerase